MWLQRDSQSDRNYVPNKWYDLNLKVLDMITGINEPKTLIKVFDVIKNVNIVSRQCNSSL